MSQQETKKRSRRRSPNNPTGFHISDALWTVLEPLLPVHVNTHRFGEGRPRVPDRPWAAASFSVLRTGCQWQTLDQTALWAHSTAQDRFQAWRRQASFSSSGKSVSSSLTSCVGSRGSG